MPTPSHAWARDVLLKAWPLVVPDVPTLPELQLAGAVAHLESGYGSGWKGAGEGSNNWGAVKCVDPIPCPPTCFPNKDYGGTFCFRRYATPEEGAAAVVRNLTVRRPNVWAAMKAGDAMLMGAEMGKGPLIYHQSDPEAYGKGLFLRAEAIAKALGEPLAVFGPAGPVPQPLPVEPPTIAGGLSTGQRIAAFVAAAALGYGAIRIFRGA